MKGLMFILSFFVLVSCQDVKKPQKPDNLIDKETMVSILAEAYTGNAARTVDNKTLRESGIEIDAFIYEKFKVDSAQFAQSNAFYTNDINAYMELMTEVEKLLLEKKTVIDTILAQQKRRENDSFEAVKLKIKKEKDSLKNLGLSPLVQDSLQ